MHTKNGFRIPMARFEKTSELLQILRLGRLGVGHLGLIRTVHLCDIWSLSSSISYHPVPEYTCHKCKYLIMASIRTHGRRTTSTQQRKLVTPRAAGLGTCAAWAASVVNTLGEMHNCKFVTSAPQSPASRFAASLLSTHPSLTLFCCAYDADSDTMFLKQIRNVPRAVPAGACQRTRTTQIQQEFAHFWCSQSTRSMKGLRELVDVFCL